MAKKKKIIIRTAMTFKFGPHCYERPTGKSKTVQGQSYSIKELITKNAQGIAPNVQREGVYFDGDIDSVDVEKFQNLDLVERDEIIEDSKMKVDSIKKKIESRKKSQKDEIEKKSEKSTDEVEAKVEPTKEVKPKAETSTSTKSD